MKKHILFWILTSLIMSVNICAQTNFWINAKADNFRSELKDRISSPKSYRTVSLNTEDFLNFAANSRDRFNGGQSNTLEFILPMPNGENETLLWRIRN